VNVAQPTAPVEFVRTELIVTPRELRAITGWEGKLPEEMQVCAGAWQREGHVDSATGVYRFWKDPDWEDC
jgi:hypothetical protein